MNADSNKKLQKKIMKGKKSAKMENNGGGRLSLS